MRIIGLDIHRAFAEAVAWEDGKLRRLGRVDMRRDLLSAFAATLSKEDVVVVEATGNAAAVTAVIAPHVRQVVIAIPKQVRVIGRAQGGARQKGAAHAYNVKSHRDEERRWVEQAETAYARFVAGWNPRGPKRVRTGAATEARR